MPLLLSFGADLNLGRARVKTPAPAGGSAAVRLSVRKEWVVHTPLMLLISMGAETAVAAMLKLGADLRLVILQGVPPMVTQPPLRAGGCHRRAPAVGGW